jgi:hypothetical protein
LRAEFSNENGKIVVIKVVVSFSEFGALNPRVDFPDQTLALARI